MNTKLLISVGGLACASVCGHAIAQACDPIVSQTIFGQQGEVLGSSIQLMGDQAVIGAYRGIADGVDSGVAYLYSLDGEQWVETGRLVPPDGASEDWFGLYIAVDHDRMLIGSVSQDNGGSNVGAVYAYKLLDGQWEYEQKLSPINAVVDGGFGIVDIEGSRAVVGAPGRLFGNFTGSTTIFEHDGEHWSATQTITPSDGQAGDWFGISVSLDGDRLIIGASENDDEILGSFAGSAYVYELNGEHWVEQAKLVPSDLFNRGSFGRSVWLNNDRIVVGAPSAHNGIGQIYCYTLNNGQWIEQQIIEPEIPMANSFFGEAFSIHNDVMVVAKDVEENHEAYVYRLVNGQWVPAGVLENTGDDQIHKFGVVLDVHENAAMLISLSRPEFDGSVVVYDLGCSPCPADFTGDWVLNSDDIEQFIELFSAGNAAADLHPDGELNFFDVSAYLEAFAAGCP